VNRKTRRWAGFEHVSCSDCDGGRGVGVVACSSLMGLGCAVVRSASSLGRGGAYRGGLDRLPRSQASKESLSGMYKER